MNAVGSACAVVQVGAVSAALGGPLSVGRVVPIACRRPASCCRAPRGDCRSRPPPHWAAIAVGGAITMAIAVLIASCVPLAGEKSTQSRLSVAIRTGNSLQLDTSVLNCAELARIVAQFARFVFISLLLGPVFCIPCQREPSTPPHIK